MRRAVNQGGWLARLPDDDPNVTITFKPDTEIHRAMQLPECPPNIALGIDAAELKENFVQWLDDIIRGAVKANVDVIDRDAEGAIVQGSYSGLRSGEWAKVVAQLATPALSRWHVAMLNVDPPVSCGKLKVADGIAGRGNNTSSFPAIAPFH